jgi:hypothetical protein
MAGLAHFPQLCQERFRLGALAFGFPVNEPGMAGGLPKPEQRLENVHLRLRHSFVADRPQE